MSQRPVSMAPTRSGTGGLIPMLQPGTDKLPITPVVRHGRHKDRRERIAELGLSLLMGPEKARFILQMQPSSTQPSPEASLTIITELKSLLVDEEEGTKMTTNVSEVQGLFRMRLARLAHTRIKGEYNKKRNDAFNDLCRTEAEFVGKLRVVATDYLQPLRKQVEAKQGAVLSAAELRVLFGTVEELLHVHEEILSALQPIKERAPNVRGVGDLFSAISSKLRIYGEYVKNCPASVDMCLRLEESNPKFAEFISAVQSRSEGIMKYVGLADLLPCPLNQITQYEIILQSMVDNTNPNKYGAQEAESLTKAAALLKQINAVVKISYEMSHCRQKVVQVQTLLGGTKLLDGVVADRRFIRDLEVSYSAKKSRKGASRRKMYIFSDLVIFADGNHVTDHVALEGLKIEKDEESGLLLNGTSFSCCLTMKSDMERDTILKEISQLLHHNKNENMVFGNDLNTLLAKEDRLNSVPIEIEKMFEALEKPGAIDAEGLFRIAGSVSEVTELKRRLDEGWGPEAEAAINRSFPHTVASLVKVFFREMPEPLMTFAQYDACMAVCASSETKEHQLQKIAVVLQNLPLTNQTLLRYLVTFLRKVADYSSKNLMNSRNLGLMFAPNILRPKEETVESSLNLPRAAELVQIMIDNSSRLWPQIRPASLNSSSHLAMPPAPPAPSSSLASPPASPRSNSFSRSKGEGKAKPSVPPQPHPTKSSSPPAAAHTTSPPPAAAHAASPPPGAHAMSPTTAGRRLPAPPRK